MEYRQHSQHAIFWSLHVQKLFQNILWNLHISDPDETNPPRGEAYHDPLFLVRPMVEMMQRNFHTKYRPGKELSLDESMCPFKGRVHFKSLPLAVTQTKLKQGETVFCHKNNGLALKWMDKREVYILSGLHKATNIISKITNYKGQKVTKPQPVFLYNRYMSSVDLIDQFLQYYSA